MDSPAETAGVANIDTAMKDSGSQNTSFEDDVLGSERLVITESEDENPNKSSELKVATTVIIKPTEMAVAAVVDTTEKQSLPEGVGGGSGAIAANSAENFIVDTRAIIINTVDGELAEHTGNAAEANVSSTTPDGPNSLTTDERADYHADAEIQGSSRKNKKMFTLIDSESDEEMSAQQRTAEATEMQHSALANKTKNPIIDSDTESDGGGQSPNMAGDDAADNDSSDDSLPSFKSRKRTSSDNSTGGLKKSLKKQQRHHMMSIVDTDSDEDKENPPKHRSKKLNKKLKHKQTTAKVSAVIDSDSDGGSSVDSTENLPIAPEDAGESGDSKEKGGQKPMRASAKRALDEMQALQSEQQRLHREANISVPYHKPKAHNLKEFLNRHSNALPSKPIKMTPEELEEYDKLMDQRRKEAAEFFKPEKDTAAAVEFPEAVPEATSAVEETSIGENATTENAEEYEAAPELMPVEMMDPANETEETVQMAVAEKSTLKVPSPKQPVIIEEIRILPRLDLSGFLNVEDEMQMYRVADDERIPDVQQKSDERELNEKMVFPKDFPESAKYETRSAQLGLITSDHLSYSPTLSGDPSMLIDLESGEMVPRATPIDSWLQRIIATQVPGRERKTQSVGIINVQSGRIIQTHHDIKVNSDKSDGQERKPGASHEELQKELKAKIYQRRLEKVQKRIEELKKLQQFEENEEFDDDEDKLAEDEVEYIEEDSEDNCQSAQNCSYDDEEEPLPKKRREDDRDEIEDVDVGSDIEDDDEDVNDADDDDEQSESSHQAPQKKLQRKSRLVKPNLESDEESDEPDYGVDISTVQLPPRLYELESQQNPSDMENDIVDLCSGRFDGSQAIEMPLISQMPVTQFNNDAIEELEELCSGTFDNIQTQQGQRRRLVSSSATEESADESNDVEKRKNIPHRAAKLGFSDDEQSDEGAMQMPTEEEVEANYVTLEVVGDSNDEPPTYIDYDSEENEVEVQLTKKQRADLAVNNFIEKEAELSGSEVESADEDERHMDAYDIELGDEDNIDREKVQQELGKIHARKMLDEDMRDLRRLKEMFVEDEERDGVGRERQFRWKNSEAGFTLDAPKEENANGDGDDSDEERDEHLMRKKRFEREQMLQENAQQLDDLPGTSSAAQRSTPTFSSTKRLTIIKGVQMKKDKTESKLSSPFLIAKGSPTIAKSARGSFLFSDQSTLTKLVGLTKDISDGSAEDGTAGTVSVKSVERSNFAFTTLSVQKHEQNLKRKADMDEPDSTSAHGKNFVKKSKKAIRKDECLIDRLQ